MARSSHHRTSRSRAAAGGSDPAGGSDVAEAAGERDVPVAGSDLAGEGEAAGERQVWCDTCEAMVPIGDLDEDDCCPTCGEPVGPRRVPWKFRLMIGASVIYLGYRAYQGIEWLAHHV